MNRPTTVGPFAERPTTKAHVATDGNGRGLAALITPGRAADSPMLPAMLKQVVLPWLDDGSPRHNPTRSSRIRRSRQLRTGTCCGANGPAAPYTQRSDQVANQKGANASVDGHQAPTRSNTIGAVVERAFNEAKHWRAVTTRYDKLARPYHAGFTLDLIVEWLE